MNERKDVNEVCLVGRRVTDFLFSHSSWETDYYVADFVSERLSGIQDRIPVTVSERQREMLSRDRDGYVRIEGYFQSYNRIEQGRRRLVLSVFARTVDIAGRDKPAEENRIYLVGYVCNGIPHHTGRNADHGYPDGCEPSQKGDGLSAMYQLGKIRADCSRISGGRAHMAEREDPEPRLQQGNQSRDTGGPYGI